MHYTVFEDHLVRILTVNKSISEDQCFHYSITMTTTNKTFVIRTLQAVQSLRDHYLRGTKMGHPKFSDYANSHNPTQSIQQSQPHQTEREVVSSGDSVYIQKWLCLTTPINCFTKLKDCKCVVSKVS